MKVIDGIHVLEYKEWIKIPAVKELEESIEDCEHCDGAGTHSCTCGHEHDCEECGGTGKEFSLKDVYDEEIKKELHKLLKWKASVEESQ